jgi:hypothetical protein
MKNIGYGALGWGDPVSCGEDNIQHTEAQRVDPLAV